MLLLCLALAQPPAGGPHTQATVAEVLRTAASRKHPYILFSDVRETTGFRNRTERPWSDFLRYVRTAADRKVPIVSVYDGPITGAVVHAGGRAHEGDVMFTRRKPAMDREAPTPEVAPWTDRHA